MLTLLAKIEDLIPLVPLATYGVLFFGILLLALGELLRRIWCRFARPKSAPDDFDTHPYERRAGLMKEEQIQ
jgi:hypothetical protein